MPDGATNFTAEREIGWTGFPDRWAKDIIRHDPATLDEIAAFLRRPIADRKEDLPYVKLARFGDTKSPVRTDPKTGRQRGDSYRHDANVVAVEGVECDHDHGDLTFVDAVERLRAANITGIVATTPSNAPGHPRWRLLCPLATPIEGTEEEMRERRAVLVSRLNGLMDGEFAPESWVLSQSFFFGSVTGKQPVTVEVVHGKGYIDHADDLDFTAIGKPGGEPKDREACEPREDKPITVEQLQAMTAAIVAKAPELDLHYPALMRLVMAIGRTPVEDDDDKAERKAAATAIRDAVPDSGMDDSRLDNSFDAVDRDGGVGLGTFIWYAQQAGWKRPALSDEAKYGKPSDYAEYRPNDSQQNGTGEGEEIPNSSAHDLHIAKLRKRFRAIDPVEAMRKPPPRYWDAARLLLRTNDGGVAMLFAQFSNFKTTWALGHSLQTAKARGCRVLYIVGEGADGFGAKTLQACVKDWNDHNPDDPMTDEWLKEHLCLIGCAPHLLNNDEVEALCEEHEAFNPDLVFLDTLGSAVAGDDLNAPAVGMSIGDKTRHMAWAFKADTYLVHHVGKDASRGATGSQYLMNDPAMALEAKYDKDTQRLTITVQKDRWGERGRKVVFGTRKVHGLKEYDNAGNLVNQRGEFIAIYGLSPEQQKESAKQGDEDAKAQAERDEALLRKVVMTLASITRSEETTVLSWELAMKLDPKADDETEEEFAARARAYGEKLTRLTAAKGAQQRKTRDGYSVGLLAEFVKRTEAGENFKPARFRLPGTWRELAKLWAKEADEEIPF